MSGEAKSRSDLHLPGVQEDLVKAIQATGKPVVVLVNAGRPLIFNWTAGNVPAIVYTWWLGTEAGNAIADAISGAVRGAINRVLSYAGRIINNFINGINTAISVINAIPGVSINKLNSLEIPQLAKGAVLPPNKPFLAMVGDQKSGTNVEAPLDTIVEAVKIALGGSNGFSGRIEVPVYLGNRQIALAVREAENEMGTETVTGGFANAY
jgi:hypothetical protein